MTDVRSEEVLIEEALFVQSACNLSGVVNSFLSALKRLWKIADEKGEGTTWVNTHRVSRLYADKIKQLAGEVKLEDFDNNVVKG